MVIFHWWCYLSKRSKTEVKCKASRRAPHARASRTPCPGVSGCLWPVAGAGSAARVGPAGTAVAVLPPPDASWQQRRWEEPPQPPLSFRTSSSPHKVPLTSGRRHALSWSLPQMAYILLGHLVMRFYFIIYISSAAHKSLHSGSNGLSFSCYYSLKHVLN